MKAKLRIPTKTQYAFIEVEVDGNAKEIVAAYQELSQEYWGEIVEKKKKVATKVTNGLVKKIECIHTVTDLEALDSEIKAIKDSAEQKEIIKLYNDKKIKLIDKENV